jgi:hypothetical protein
MAGEWRRRRAGAKLSKNDAARRRGNRRRRALRWQKHGAAWAWRRRRRCHLRMRSIAAHIGANAAPRCGAPATALISKRYKLAWRRRAWCGGGGSLQWQMQSIAASVAKMA